MNQTIASELVTLRVPAHVAELHARVGDAGIERILRVQLMVRQMRSGSLGAWTEDQRQAVGEALTIKLAEVAPPGEDGLPDWFDARNMDEILDVIEKQLLPAAPAPMDLRQAGNIKPTSDGAEVDVFQPWVGYVSRSGERLPLYVKAPTKGVWERRHGSRVAGGEFNWGHWTPCTEAEAKRVSGLLSWQVRCIMTMENHQ